MLRRTAGWVCTVSNGRMLALILSLTVFLAPLFTAQAGGEAGESSISVAPTSQLGTAPREDAASQASTSMQARLRFDRISIEDGLSQSVVLCMLQDSQGFMWFGTEDGLNRYDGYQFRIYRHDPENPDSLSNDLISALYQDREGSMWVGTRGGGLNRFDRETGRFVRYQNDPKDAHSLGYDDVVALGEDREGTLWIGTYGGGLDRFDRETGRFDHYRNDPDDPFSLSSDRVLTLYLDRAGDLWIGTGDGGLNRLDRETGRFIRFTYDPDDAHSLGGNYVTAIVEDLDGELWIGTYDGGLSQFDRETETFIRYQNDPYDGHSLSSNLVTSLGEDRDGVLWVGTFGGGLNRFDRETGRFFRYQNDPNDVTSLSRNEVRSIYQDREGALWIGTHGGGLNKLDRGRNFVHYRADPNDPSGLADNLVLAIYQDRSGTIWIGTGGGGLDLWDRERGRFLHHRSSPHDPHSLSHDSILSIYEDGRGNLWVGTWGGGLDRFDRETELFTHYQYIADDPTSLSSPVVASITEDQAGSLWVGTWGGGLDRLDPETQQFTRYLHDPNDPRSLSNNTVYFVYQDRDGDLWIGTDGGGVDRLDWDTQAFIHFRNDPDDPRSLSSDIVLSVCEDSAGVLWFGTASGLNKLDRTTQQFTRYTEKDGLPNDMIYAILEDRQGFLWLSTNRGLSRFDPQSETFRNYSAEDGLQSDEFNVNAAFKSSDGELFFGGINGFNTFYPEQIQDNPYVPPIVLTSLTQGGEALRLDRAVESLSETTLNWPRNFFEFEYAALSYAQPERNQYAYMLEGFDQNWIEMGTRRFGRYTNLPGGTYTLRIKGSNNDGIWEENGLALRITVVPPFWQTGLFRGLIVLIVLGGVYSSYRFRVRSIKARSQDLEQQVEARTAELARRTEDLEHRTQELSALNTVAAVVSRSLDLHEILNNALDKTLEITSTEAGGIYLVEEKAEVLTVAVYRGFSEQFVAGIDRLKLGEGFSGHVAASGQPLVVRNVSTDPRLTRMAVREEGLRSLATVPIGAKGRVLGTLFAVTHGEREFADQDVQLLTAIGHQIGVAIENARFFNAEQRRAEQFRVISEVGRRITSILDINEVLLHVARLIQQALGYDHVGIALIEGDVAVYRVGAGRLWDDPQFEFQPAELKVGKQGLTGWVAATGEPILVPDVSQEPRYVPMRNSNTRSELAVPIKAKGKVIGVLDAQSRRLHTFDESDLLVLQSLANQAGIAIENARLYEQARQLAVVEERSRLARDLHDAVTQTLFSISLIAEVLPQIWERDPEAGRLRLEQVRQGARSALAEMRTLLLELRPAALADTDLADLLRQLGAATGGRAQLSVAVQERGACKPPPQVHIALYRIAQEALNNAAKHARAQHATVTLDCQPGKISLCIEDDGRGFDVEHVPPGHFGLNIMRERAEAVAAKLEVVTRVGQGTQIRVMWPADGEHLTENILAGNTDGG